MLAKRDDKDAYLAICLIAMNPLSRSTKHLRISNASVLPPAMNRERKGAPEKCGLRRKQS